MYEFKAEVRRRISSCHLTEEAKSFLNPPNWHNLLAVRSCATSTNREAIHDDDVENRDRTRTAGPAALAALCRGLRSALSNSHMEAYKWHPMNNGDLIWAHTDEIANDLLDPVEV